MKRAVRFIREPPAVDEMLQACVGCSSKEEVYWVRAPIENHKKALVEGLLWMRHVEFAIWWIIRRNV